jgi:hypothetical protein
MEEQEYLAHPIHALVQTIQATFDSEAFNDSSVTESTRNTMLRERTAIVVKQIALALASTPGSIVAVAPLGSLYNALTNVAHEVNQFVATKNVGHLVNAASHIDPCLQSMWAFPAIYSDAGQAAVPALIAEVQKSSQAAMALLEKQKGELAAEVRKLQDEVTAQTVKVAELTSTIATQRASALETSAAMQLDYTDREAIRKATFETALSSAQATLAEYTRGFQADAGEVLANMKVNDIEADKLLGIIGNKGVTTNFKTVAEAEAKVANLWRWITAGLFALGLGGIIWNYYTFQDSPAPISLTASLIHFLSVFAIAPVAWYTGRESARHRTNAEHARKMELELFSVGPFIAALPEADRHQILSQLVPKYFGTVTPAGESIEPLAIKAITEGVAVAVKGLKAGG